MIIRVKRVSLEAAGVGGSLATIRRGCREEIERESELCNVHQSEVSKTGPKVKNETTLVFRNEKKKEVFRNVWRGSRKDSSLADC